LADKRLPTEVPHSACIGPREVGRRLARDQRPSGAPSWVYSSRLGRSYFSEGRSQGRVGTSQVSRHVHVAARRMWDEHDRTFRARKHLAAKRLGATDGVAGTDRLRSPLESSPRARPEQLPRSRRPPAMGRLVRLCGLPTQRRVLSTGVPPGFLGRGAGIQTSS
jgi:hypothetical protein